MGESTGAVSTEEYMGMLQKIEDALPLLDTDAAEQALEELFAIKPVRLKWYLIKSQLMLKEGKNPEDIIAFLADKCSPWYAYEGVNEYFDMMALLAEKAGDRVESNRYLYQKRKMNDTADHVLEDQIWVLLSEVYRQDTFEKKVIDQLCEKYYIAGNIYLALLWQVVRNRITHTENISHDWVISEHNAGYYYNRLTEDANTVFVLLETSENDIRDIRMAGIGLTYLGKRTFIIQKPVNLGETESEQELLEESLKTVRCENKIQIFQAYSAGSGDQEISDQGALLCYIAEHETSDNLLTVLGSGLQIDQLAMQKKMKPQLERLTEAMTDYMEENLAVARFGDYLSYIANIYRTTRDEIRKELYREPTCDFSIIIPCRNDGNTLFYTLKTCLNQDYQGDYEIVVSDNADRAWGDDTPCARICREINDSRIHYYRTPVTLSLPKNFEYGFLKARGAFLLSMGADDGILPWALSRLSMTLNALPQQKILLWNEAMYKWPGTDKRLNIGNGNAYLAIKQDKLQNPPQVLYYKTEEVFNACFDNYGMMYMLPQLYHNSGIRREYLTEIYERTGVLWDGMSQDICMAITVGSIEKQLCMTEDLLTVTGISNGSIGANFRIENTDLSQDNYEKKYKSTLAEGIHSRSYIERLVSCVGAGGDFVGLYSCILYVYAIGVISDDLFEKFDWHKMFVNMMLEQSKGNLQYELVTFRMRYCASLFGKQFQQWFDDKLYDLCPEIIYEELRDTFENQDVLSIQRNKYAIEGHPFDNVYQASLFIQNLFE